MAFFMGDVVYLKVERNIRDERETNVLSDIDNVFKTISTNEITETLEKAKKQFKTIGYKIQSTNKLVDKKKFHPKKTILFKEFGVGFSTAIKKKFTDNFWVIYPVQIESTNGFMELVSFIQQKIEVSKNGREK